MARFIRFQVERLLGMGYPKHIDNIITHLTVYEKQALYSLARKLPLGSTVVEIGSYLGASASCLAAGIYRSGSELHCVDTFMNDSMPDVRQDIFPDFLENMKPFAEVIQVHRGLSQDMAGDLERQIDLLFIDGDHSWQGITTDLELYVPLMRDEAVLVMHDVRASEACYRALNQLILPAEVKRLVRLPNLYAGRIRPHIVQIKMTKDCETHYDQESRQAID